MLTLKDKISLLTGYFKTRLMAQVKVVSFIILYLIFFQLFILKIPIENAFSIAMGIVAIIVGLTLFMEGLILGIMPVGESLGLKLPANARLWHILIFAFILGLGATFAEPAISVLHMMGSQVDPEKAPLLHFLLYQRPKELVSAVAIGVGLAVIAGMLRFLKDWSLKPFLYPSVISCLALSSYGFFSENFSHIVSLAWDCGAVTTGPVTVPLVLALGLGVSRVVSGHTSEGASSGLGVVTLASLFPIISVLTLCLYYDLTKDFSEFSALALPQSLSEQSQPLILTQLFESFMVAAQAILPLIAFMFFVYKILLKEKFLHADEIILGLIFSLLGFSIFTLGINTGFKDLGNQIGQSLPVAYTSIESDQQITIENFDPQKTYYRYNSSGEIETFFYFLNPQNQTQEILFEEQYFDKQKMTYTYPLRYGPLWQSEAGWNMKGYLVVLFFAFFMGYGSTLAEPALNALGSTVERISVGVFKKNLLIQSVAMGVGVGILLGLLKIILHLPLTYFLIPLYCFLLILSFFSNEEFVNIAWDSAGVTTGPVTVPLVLALGTGIGLESAAIEGFGILAMASVCPIISVLTVGFWSEYQRKSALKYG